MGGTTKGTQSATKDYLKYKPFLKEASLPVVLSASEYSFVALCVPFVTLRGPKKNLNWDSSHHLSPDGAPKKEIVR